MKRIPRIKFPQRRLKSSISDYSSQSPAVSTTGDAPQIFMRSSDVPAAPTNIDVGGKASLQPKRTAVSDGEIEAILLGGCFCHFG